MRSFCVFVFCVCAQGFIVRFAAVFLFGCLCCFVRFEAIALRLEAIASKLEAIPLRLTAISSRLEAIAPRLEAIALRLEAIALWLEAIAFRCVFLLCHSFVCI